MPLTIDDPEIDRMAEELARRDGVGVAEAVKAALAARLGTEPAAPRPKPIDMEAIRAIQREVAALPVYDDRSADEIIGYDEHGAFR